jgi:hypothetical protein
MAGSRMELSVTQSSEVSSAGVVIIMHVIHSYRLLTHANLLTD